MSLKTQTVIVTGGAGGIGKSLVRHLIGQGLHVGIIDVDQAALDLAEELNSESARCQSVLADISDADAVQDAVQTLRTALGPVQGLVNNAGIVNNIAPLEKMKQAAWEKEIAVNLTGAFNLIRAVIPQMREAGYGRIVNVSSGAARGGLINQAGYSASKAGLLGLTRAVTLEYARHDITCNAVLPGMTATEKVEAMPDMIKSAALSMTPAGRFGSTDEASHLIAFLLSAEAGFINGADIDITGGAHLNVMPLGSRKEATRQKDGT